MSRQFSHSVRSGLRALSAGLLSLCFVSQAHSLQEHQQLKGPFATSREVTVKCLECHLQQAKEVMGSPHWTWVRKGVINGESALFGKKESLAGFAIDVSSNPGRCMACHISNDPGNINPEAPAPDMVDCLVCHDTTGSYPRPASSSAPPPDQPDLALIARNVGRPAPGNCGACHFADCGLSPSGAGNRAFAGDGDIHMSPAGGNFSCQTCHAGSSGHSFSRHLNLNDDSSSFGEGCASCHSGDPHGLDLLNKHGESISCLTCHIPADGRNRPVLIGWNWLMTGKTVPVHQHSQGGRFQMHDRNGIRTATDIEPVYLWDDGSDMVYTRGRRIQPGELTVLQRPAERSTRSKIAPFRVIYSTQLYDLKYRYLISPLLHPDGADLFSGTDLDSIAGDGMKALVLPYSGQYGFTATAMYRRISHGVAPAGQALGCLDCHGRAGRMNWAELGFDTDPWSNGLTMKAADEESGGAANDAGPTTLPEVRETDIPAGSDE